LDLYIWKYLEPNSEWNSLRLQFKIWKALAWVCVVCKSHFMYQKGTIAKLPKLTLTSYCTMEK
jgi:hypothetical protein